ncbi:MAG: polysaccharide biosynthesis C-terminal domain-containing protein [Lachnospiraceae bacterium]|nr:polysaccharide biosynthesis C-terminal domain-containing protein [Lachnospiraceae bacterium]
MKTIVTDSSFYKKVLNISLPIAAQSFITIGINMMDTIMLGVLGETALSASSLANQFINLYHVMCMGMGMGAAVLTSRYWGMQDMKSLKKSVTLMLRVCVSLATVFAIVTVIAPGSIMRIYTPDADVIYEGVRYLRWSVASFWLLGLSLTVTIVLRSVGLVRLPLFASIVSFFVNIGANYIFIFGKFGAPAMGVAGAAFGTLISRVVEFAVIDGYFFFVDKRIGYRLKNLVDSCSDQLNEYIRISIPVLVSDTLLGLGNNAVAVVMGHIGSSFVSANAITTVTQQLTTVMTQALSQTGCIVVGNTLGEGDVDRAQQEGVTFWFLGTLIGLVAGGVILLISEPVIGFYAITEETHAIASQLMRAIAFIVIFQSMNSILTKGVMQGGGDTRFLMVADVLFLWIVAVPLGAMAGLVWYLPAFWIYVCLKLDQIIKAFWCLWRLHSRKWIKRVYSAGQR